VTAAEIKAALFDSPKGLTPPRVQKAKALAARTHVLWADVLSLLTPEQRTAVDA
jgi:hypothetical protein